MLHKRTVLILVLIACVLWALNIRGSSSFLSDKIKIGFSQLREAIANAYQRHIDQASTIAKYQVELEAYRRLQFSYADLNARNQALALEIHDLSNLAHTPPPTGTTPDAKKNLGTPTPSAKKTPTPLYQAPHFLLTRVYGFAQLNNPYEILLDVQGTYPRDQIFGMVAFGRAIGIALQKNGRFVGLLHGDAQASYSVAIKSGGKVYYGFITNQNFKTYVDFLPAYAPLKAGDVVVTSGLDGIFSAGIFVGKVAKISNHYTYKKALLQLEHLDRMLFYTTLVISPPPPPSPQT
ncbi:rod shape-determining protein MreC [Helicobacter felis]|uniref:rod shape-determining protein MreC n=1 Tax=Helicobacter felis TaxID=214 RepID=UPI000EF6464A|nr:rod shape-determining protein MreC [Helicobacter felis]